MNGQIKPFNFITIGTETNGISPSLPYTKDLKEIEFKDFIDYKTGMSSKDLPLPYEEYWKTLEDVLTVYVRHNIHKFYCVEGIAQRKHNVVDKIRYISKESNNLDDLKGIDDNSYFEYHKRKKFLPASFCNILNKYIVRADQVA